MVFYIEIIKHPERRKRKQKISQTKKNSFFYTGINQANIGDVIKVGEFHSKNPITGYSNIN